MCGRSSGGEGGAMAVNGVLSDYCADRKGNTRVENEFERQMPLIMAYTSKAANATTRKKAGGRGAT